ncbi:MBL fold metallo-hydrolase [Pseudomonas sp. NPDC089407]|uniref:MBL fold metallo-hydrolase n=1 Tax=Pseudomonas sp. NPDC089407 TaxID=3364464 RepID=UPI00384CA702
MSSLDAQGHEWRAGLRFPWPVPPANGEVQAVAEGVLWLRMPLPFGLDHINLYLLRHGQGWVAVDTGLNNRQTREIWERLFEQALGGLPLLAVICTHFHSDHVGVLGWLTERFRCPVFMTASEYQAMHQLGGQGDAGSSWAFRAHYQKAGFSAEQTEALFPLLNSAHFRPEVPTSFHRLREGSELRIGGRLWQVRIGRGHSPEHACLYCVEDQLLIAGDQVLPRITSSVCVQVTEPDANPLREWLESLEHLRSVADDVLVLPAHERPFFNLHLRLDQLRDHHHAHLQQVLGACTLPRSAAELMAVLFPKVSGRFDELMALGETLAHINYLIALGQLGREEVAGVLRYGRTPAGVEAKPILGQL